MKKRIDYYFNIDKTNRKRKKKRSKIRLNKSSLKRLNEIISEKLANSNDEKIDLMIRSAGLRINPEEYVMIRWVFVAVGGGILYFAFGNLIFLFIGGIVGYLLPNRWLKGMIRKRIEKFNKELPDMINIVIGSLKSGYSFPQALKTVVEECEPPIKEEIGLLLKEMSYGVTIDSALNNLCKRMPSNDLELMVQAILIQRQVGGNLAGVLQIIVNTIRERIRIQGQVKSLTSQGRLSGRVIGALPIILGFMIYLMNPEYISLLFTNTLGKILIFICIISGVIGFILINKLTKIEV
ncbi:hypothetical protein SH2C18_49640 [Clostridium sediminicola]|uniref:type II secretion system F family protein n=1 Tax=Clostridium sediminicola TaxID=3114879 RepID=UPI0031F20DB6